MKLNSRVQYFLIGLLLGAGLAFIVVNAPDCGRHPTLCKD